MWFTHRVDHRYFARISTLALILSVPLLLYTWKFGETINEASRWLVLPVLDQAFQPSDLAKLALITHLAGMLSRRQQVIHNFKSTMLPLLLWCGAICGLIALTDLSSADPVVCYLFAAHVHRTSTRPLPIGGCWWPVGLIGMTAGSLGQRGKTAWSRLSHLRRR